MKRVLGLSLVLFAMAIAVGCESTPVEQRPIFKLSPAQLDDRLPAYQGIDPWPERVISIARSNIGQPYELYLLGEAPFETIDPQPVYNLKKSDCVVFVEHTLAMSMSSDFPRFMRMLQRIRYHNGEIGVRTRNHYTETDWNVNNAWLLHEITEEIGGAGVKQYKQTIDRKGFFKNRYKLDVDVPKEKTTQSYVPYQSIDEVKPLLRTGDVVNFVKGTSETSAWVHHLGFVAVMPDGEVHIIHSTVPRVREEKIDDFIARNTKDNAKNDAKGKARHRGFKFLRLNDDAMARLTAIDGADAPKVTLPAASPVSLETYIERELAK